MSNVYMLHQHLSQDMMSEQRRGFGSRGYKPDGKMDSMTGETSFGSLGGSGGGGAGGGTSQALRANKGSNESFEKVNNRGIAARELEEPAALNFTESTGERSQGGMPKFVYEAKEERAENQNPDPVSSANSDVITGAQVAGGGSTAWMESGTPLAMLTSITGGGGC